MRRRYERLDELNAFIAAGFAPSPACSAAACKVALSARLPVRATSTSGRRHGLVPTPPAATRAERIVSRWMSSATAAETRANSKLARSRTFR